jgi:hypothetical protein
MGIASAGFPAKFIGTVFGMSSIRASEMGIFAKAGLCGGKL